jgi:hypothetical protein
MLGYSGVRMVVWPCLLILDGDDELMYLDSYSEFVTECSDLIITGDDFLIDTMGESYSITFMSPPVMEEKKTITLIAKKEHYSTEQITDFIRRHEFSKAQVCLTKIYFTDTAEAISSMAYELK